MQKQCILTVFEGQQSAADPIQSINWSSASVTPHYKSRCFGSLLVWSIQVCSSTMPRSKDINIKDTIVSPQTILNTQRNCKKQVTSHNLQLSYQVHDNTITEKERLFTLNRAWQHSLTLHFASKPTTSLLEQCALDRQDQNANVCP